MEFKVKSFRVQVKEPDGKEDTPATRFVRSTVAHYMNGDAQTFTQVVDATTKTREQIQNSGIVKRLDGSLRWTTELLPSKVKLPRFTKVFRRKLHLPMKIPSILDSVILDGVVHPRPRDFGAKATVDSVGGVGVEAYGSQAFIFDQPMLAEGSISVTHLNPWRPEMDLSLHRFLMPPIAPNSSLPDFRKLTVNAHRKENAGRLHYLASEHCTGAELRYHPSSHQSFKVGLDQYDCTKRASAYLQRIPETGLMLGSHLFSTFSWLRQVTWTGPKWRHECHFGVDTLTPVTDILDSERTFIKAHVSSEFKMKLPWPHLSLRVRSVLSGGGFPVWPPSFSPPTIADVPLSKRLYLGGPSSSPTQPSMRGFSSGAVGGLVVPPSPSTTAFRSPQSLAGGDSSTEHLGGLMQIGSSAEVTLDSLRPYVGELTSLNDYPQVKQVVESSKPFCFVDLGCLSPKIAASHLLSLTHVSAGLGVRLRVPGNIALELTAAQPLKTNWLTSRQRFQFNFSLAED